MNAPLTVSAQARDAALEAVEAYQVKPAGLVEYRSRGRVLVIGGEEAIEFAPRLTDNLHAEVLFTHGNEEPGAMVIPLGGRQMDLKGHLGAFTITLGEQGKHNYQLIEADMILDLSRPACLTMPVKPFGYFTADSANEISLLMALNQMKELTGTFEKPRFFDYDASICAHARSGHEACRRCIDSCPAVAITSLGESIEVDPYLCQGGGVCATACPTGAIRYTYPQAADTLERIRILLGQYDAHGGQQPIIGFISEADYEQMGWMPDNLLPVVVEELASVGMDTWLSSLAYGASAVRLIQAGSVPRSVEEVLLKQLEIAQSLLDGLQYPTDSLQYISIDELEQPVEVTMPAISHAAYAGMNEKRQTLYFAIDHLASQASALVDEIALPPGAPFGRIQVNKDKCTLCMACTSVCPASAVQAGDDVPRLAFVENNCVQCGLCSVACPEGAIDLQARLLVDPEQRRKTQILNEQAPFHCVSCGKPFATRAIIDNMMDKLSGHSMFQSERAKRRLMMCEDCRVVDVVQDQELMESGLTKVGQDGQMRH